jgi:hypothetical protein
MFRRALVSFNVEEMEDTNIHAFEPAKQYFERGYTHEQVDRINSIAG